MNSPKESEDSKSKDKPKVSPPPEWLELPSITRGARIPTSSGLRSAIPTSSGLRSTIPTSSGLRSEIDIELTVEEDAEIDTAISEEKVPSEDSSKLAPSTSLELLEIPKIDKSTLAEAPKVAEAPLESATGPVIAPEPPSEVPAEKEGAPKCPHCGTVLTQAQLDLKATGTKVLCSECFNMV